MAGEKDQSWPWSEILLWLRIGVAIGTGIGLFIGTALWVLAIRYRPPETIEQTLDLFK